jgi:hypothetical protein
MVNAVLVVSSLRDALSLPQDPRHLHGLLATPWTWDGVSHPERWTGTFHDSESRSATDRSRSLRAGGGTGTGAAAGTSARAASGGGVGAAVSDRASSDAADHVSTPVPLRMT